MRIVFMGTPASAAATLEALVGSDHEVVGSVTRPDRPSGRGQALAPAPVRLAAARHGIPVAAPERAKDPGLLEQLRGWRPDLVAVVAYGRILPQAVLDAVPFGCVNVHYSLLPKYRGAAPMQWALLRGEAVTGVTTMRLVAEMDAGPVLLAEEVAVDPGETAASLEAKLVPVGARLLVQTVAGLGRGTLAPRPQDPAAATFAPMLRKEHGVIDWSRPAGEIERQVRAFNPWPSAFSYWQGKRVKVHGARLGAAGEGTAAPGTVVGAGADGVLVGAGAGVLALTELQLEGRKRMAADAFLRGVGLREGMRFEPPPVQKPA